MGALASFALARGCAATHIRDLRIREQTGDRSLQRRRRPSMTPPADRADPGSRLQRSGPRPLRGRKRSSPTQDSIDPRFCRFHTHALALANRLDCGVYPGLFFVGQHGYLIDRLEHIASRWKVLELLRHLFTNRLWKSLTVPVEDDRHALECSPG